MIFIIKVTTNKEERAVDMIADRITKKNLNVFSVSRPHGLRGIIGKTIGYEEIKNMVEPSVESISIEEGDIVELIGASLKGEKAKVTRIDKQKEEAVVNLLGAVVPLPVTVKLDNIKVIRRAGEENAN